MGFLKRFFKSVLMTATLLASMTFADAQTGVAPNVRFLETDQALPLGLWRIRLDGDVFSIQKNTSASNNFSTVTSAISIAANGDVTIPNDFFVTGSATVSVDTTITGQLIIDVNNLEAILVRKSADAGDVFWVDTNSDPPEVYIESQSVVAAISGPDLNLRRSRAGATVITGDVLGGVDFFGHDGTGFIESAAILAFAEGTVASTRVPSRLQFFTGTDAAPTVLTEALRIDSGQNVEIITDAAYLSWGVNSDVKLFRDEFAWELALRDGTNANYFLIYDTFTDFSNYERVRMGFGGGGEEFFILTETAGTGEDSVDIILDAEGPTAAIRFRLDAQAIEFSPGVFNFTGTVGMAGLNTLNVVDTIVGGSSLLLGSAQTSPIDSLILDSLDLGSPGQRDSHALLITGQGHDGAQHDVDWKTFVDVTNNDGTGSIYTTQTRIDSAAYTNMLFVSDTAPSETDRGAMANSFVAAGNLEAIDTTSLASQTLNDPADFGQITWNVSGDVSKSGTDAVHLHSGGTGTLRQENADLAIVADSFRTYEFTYTVAAVTETGANTATITNSFAKVVTPLDVSSAGTRTIRFLSRSNIASQRFPIDTTSTTAGDGFTLSNFSLREINGGDVNVTNALRWGEDLLLFRDGPWELGLRDGTFDNAFYIYNFFVDQSNYARLALYSGGSGTSTIEAQTAGSGEDTQNLDIIGNGTIDIFPQFNSTPTNFYRLQTGTFTFFPDDTIDMGGLSAGTPRNVFVGTAIYPGIRSTSAIDAIIIDAPDLISSGQQDSHAILMTGLADNGPGHDADWKTFVDITSDAGASTWRLQTRIDAAGFLDRLAIDDVGASFEINDPTNDRDILFNTSLLGQAGIWFGDTSEGTGNYSLAGNGATGTQINVPTGGTISLRINNADEMTLTADSFKIFGVGPHAFGGNLIGSVRNRFLGAFTSGGQEDNASLIRVEGSLTGFSGDTVGLFGLHINPDITTQSVAEFVDLVSSLHVSQPDIIDSSSGINNAANISIGKAPTEGTLRAALLIGVDQPGTYDAIVIDQRDRTVNGFDDSGTFVQTGVSYDGTPHDVDWQTFVDVTSNAGTGSQWKLQSRIDGAGFANRLTVSDVGQVTAAAGVTAGGGSVTATTFMSSGTTMSVGTDLDVGGVMTLSTADLRHSIGEGGAQMNSVLNFAGTFTSTGGGLDTNVIHMETILVGIQGDTQMRGFGSFVEIQANSTSEVTNISGMAISEPFASITGGGNILNEQNLLLDRLPLAGDNRYGIRVLGYDTLADAAIIFDSDDMSGDGQRDSEAFQFRAKAFDSATPHNVDWKNFVDVTANTGASTWTLQNRIDGAGFANKLTVTDAGDVTFAGDLSGVDLTLTGNLIFSGTPAGAGVIRLGQTDFIGIRNFADNADIAILGLGGGGDIVLLGGSNAAGVQVNSIGPHAYGGTTQDNIRNRFTGNFTSGGIGTESELIFVDGSLTGFSADTTALYQMSIAGSIATQAVTESIANIATLNLEEPNITDNLTGGGLITQASTLRIGGAPGEGVDNFALLVESGSTQLGGLVFLSSNTFLEGTFDIDVTNTQAFLVRKDGDTGDLFFIDTTNDEIEFPTGTLIIGLQTTGTQDAIVIDQVDRSGDGLDDSGAIIMTGVAFESATPHDADWKTFVDVTANTGLSTWTLQEQIDAGGFSSMLTLDEGGKLIIHPGAGTVPAETDAGTVLVVNGNTGSTANARIVIVAGQPNGLSIVAFGNELDEDRGNISYSHSQEEFTFRADNTDSFIMGDPGFTSFNANGFRLENGASSATNPTLSPDRGSTSTGLGGATGTLSLIISGTEALHITANDQVRIGVLGSDGIDETPPELLTVVGGNIEAFDAGTLGAETFTDGAFPDSTNWAGAGEWSDTISGAAIYTFSVTGNGTMTQTAAQRVTGNEGSNARWYSLTYTTSSVVDAGGLTMSITNSFAAASVPLTTANGTYTVIFQAHATTADTADFVFDITNAAVVDVLTLDDVILKEIQGGDVILGGKLTGGGPNGISITGGGTVVTFETGLGTVGADEEVDWRDGNHQAATLDENLTFTFIDPSGPAGLTMKLTQDGSGTNTVAWPAVVFWEGGTPPVITSGGNAVDLVSFYFDGTNYFGSVLQDMQ